MPAGTQASVDRRRARVAVAEAPLTARSTAGVCRHPLGREDASPPCPVGVRRLHTSQRQHHVIGGEKYKHPSTVPVDEIYKVGMEQKKRYSVGSDAELWGQKGWDEVMKKMRQMRDGSLSDSDGE